MRDLDADREDPNEDLREFLARHEADVARVVLLLAREAAENAQYHAHERAHDLTLLQDARDLLVLARELELVLAEHRVERQDVRRDLHHQHVDGLVQLLHADFDGKLVDLLVHQAEHRLSEHKASLHCLGREAARTVGYLGYLLRNTLQNSQDVGIQVVSFILLVSIENKHRLVSLRDVELGLEFQVLRLDTLEQRVDVLEGFLFVNLIVSNS